MEFRDLIKARHAIRAFQDKEIPEEKLQAVLEAIQQAPSAKNLQSFEVVLVRQKETIKKLAETALKPQPFIAEADLVLIFFANPERLTEYFDKRGIKLYPIQDATIAITQAHLAAANEGLGSVWIGSFDEEKASKILSAPTGLRPIAMLPIGYPAEEPVAKERRALDDIIHQEKF
ncbi:MAG: nitroreductase family protein [Parcubacteria group bacterium]|nr:nitroreductase family protein [Parcubacteria group bacterium]